jgi:hypothetical protein
MQSVKFIQQIGVSIACYSNYISETFSEAPCTSNQPELSLFRAHLSAKLNVDGAETIMGTQRATFLPEFSPTSSLKTITRNKYSSF